ncbi:MAG: tail fiber assembly protein [Stenotrophomonas sp.]
MQLSAGETRVTQIPASLLAKVKGDQKRVERDEMLRATDWTQMADAPLSTAQKAAVATYRQQLRDLPALPGFPDVAWPALPDLSGAASGVDPVLIP